MIIKSKKFILRPYRKGDEKSLVENINDKQISKFMSTLPFPYKPKDAAYCVNHNLKSDKSKIKKEINFVIDIEGKVAGSIGLKDIVKIFFFV